MAAGSTPGMAAAEPVAAPWVAPAIRRWLAAAGTWRPARAVPRAALKRPVTMAPRRAMPNTPPTSRLVLVMAAAMPARAAGTLDITAAVIGVMTRPTPTPIMVRFHQIDVY